MNPPEGERLGGLHGHLPHLHIAGVPNDGFDQVVLPHRHTTRGDDDVPRVRTALQCVPQGLRIVAHDAQVDRLRSQLGQHGHQLRPVAVVNLSRRQSIARGDDLIAR